MSNINTANDFLVQAKNAADHGKYERANAYTAMAQVATMTLMCEKVGAVASKIDRLASVINNGKTWH